MKTMNIWRLTLTLLAALSLASCSIEALDGDWDPMKWAKTHYKIIKEDGTKYYYVPQEGGEYTFTCKNYKGFWIADMTVTEDDHITHIYLEESPHTITLDDIQVQIESNVATIHIAPSAFSQTSHNLHTHYYILTVTAGDIFYTFRFKQ